MYGAEALRNCVNKSYPNSPNTKVPRPTIVWISKQINKYIYIHLYMHACRIIRTCIRIRIHMCTAVSSTWSKFSQNTGTALIYSSPKSLVWTALPLHGKGVTQQSPKGQHSYMHMFSKITGMDSCAFARGPPPMDFPDSMEASSLNVVSVAYLGPWRVHVVSEAHWTQR